MRKIALCFLAFILLTLPSLADEGMWIPMLLKKYNIEDMQTSKNHGRMAQDMKRELIAIIGEMKDPRVLGGLLTVTRLDVTPDLDVAKVYISVMGREGGADPVVKALNKASGHIRTEVSRRMHIRKAPRFVFTKDDSAAYAVHIDQLLQDIEKAHPAAQAEPEEQE